MRDPLQTRELDIDVFGSGEVAEMFGMPAWEFHRFLGRYQLTSSGQLGKGRGSRRWFKTEDVYRIATALFLIRDGFAPAFVADIVQELEDLDFYGGHEFTAFGISLRRTEDKPEIRIFKSNAPPEMKPGGETFYAVNLSQVTKEADQRIAKLKRS